MSLVDAGESHVDCSGAIRLESSDLTVRAGSIEVSGTITANDARIDLSAETELTVTASGVLQSVGGQVYLNAGESGTLKFSGRIDVSDTESRSHGGEARLLGYQVEMLDESSINACGYSGGGVVLIGGDYQGMNHVLPRATNTVVSGGSSIQAKALVEGDGGEIIVWADQSAIVAGSGNLQARGGAGSGNGGLIEASGKRYLYVDAAPDASAPHGDAGTWLLDPHNVTIVSGGTGKLNGGAFTSDATTTTIDPDVIEAALFTQNVTINTGAGGADEGNIVVQDGISVDLTGLNRRLTLNAHNDIEVLAA